MRRLAATGALCLALSGGGGTGSAFGASASNARYALANGCYSLVSKTAGKPVAKSPTGGYRVADAGAEGFRMQATALGEYLFYGRARDFGHPC